MAGVPRERSGVTGWALATLFLTAGVWRVLGLWGAGIPLAGPPLWDMAGHGWQGVELLRDLQTGSLGSFLLDANAQDKWPFGFSLLLLPFLALGDASFASARALSAVAYALAPAVLVLTARQVDRGPAGLAAGALAAVLWLVSPLHQVLALVILREVVAAVVLSAAFGLYVWARRRETLGAWRAAGLMALLLVLVKYNYALVLLVALGLDELLRQPPEIRWRWLPRALDPLVPWGEKSRRRRVLAVVANLLILAALVGVNPGVAVWLGLVAFTVWLIVTTRRGRIAPGAWLRSLPLRARAAIETLALPLGAWCLSPDPIHPKTLYSYLRSSHGGSERAPWEALFYARGLVEDAAPHPAIGWALAGFLVVAGLHAWRREGALRSLLILATVGCVLISLHPHKEARFAAPVMPILYLAGAFGLTTWLFGPAGVASRGGRWRLAGGGAAALLAVALVAGTAATGEARRTLDQRLATEMRLYTGDPRLFPVLDAMEMAGPGGRLAVVGVFNELSAHLVRWSLDRHHGARAPEVIEYRSRLAAGLPPEELWKRAERWLIEQRADRVLTLELIPESPFAASEDFRLHNAGRAELARRLGHRLPSAGPSRDFPELGLTLRVVAAK